MKRFFSILFTLSLFAALGNELASAGVQPFVAYLISATVVFALGVSQINRSITDFVKFDTTVDTEIWVPRLVTNLYRDNQFLLRSMDDSQYVDNKSVHKPQEAAGVAWVKNRDTSGGTHTNVNDRTDTILTYNINEWTSEPMRIKNIDKVQLSYNKMDSVLRQMLKIGKETYCDDMLYIWGATGAGVTNVFRTSGFQNNDPTAGVVTTSQNMVNGTATGARKVFGLYDMKIARTYMLKQDVGTAGWVMVMTPGRYQELLDDMLASKYRQATPEVDVKTGVIDRVMGFDIYVRSKTLTYTNAATPVRKAIGAAGAEDDNDAVLFWSDQSVCRAVGDTVLYFNPGVATLYGDVMSALIRTGGSKERASEVGVGAIVQG